MNKTRKVPSLAARQLLHVVMPGGMHPIDHRPAKGRALLGQQLHPNVQRCLLLDRQRLPPLDDWPVTSTSHTKGYYLALMLSQDSYWGDNLGGPSRRRPSRRRHEGNRWYAVIYEGIDPVTGRERRMIDRRRRAGLGLMDAAAAVATGIVASFYQARDAEDGSWPSPSWGGMSSCSDRQNTRTRVIVSPWAEQANAPWMRLSLWPKPFRPWAFRPRSRGWSPKSCACDDP